MRVAIFVAFFALSAGVALAQSPQPTPSAQEQVERTIGNLIVTNASLREQLSSAQAIIAKLQAELTEAKKAATEKP